MKLLETLLKARRERYIRKHAKAMQAERDALTAARFSRGNVSLQKGAIFWTSQLSELREKYL